jgi:hypothetical protein
LDRLTRRELLEAALEAVGGDDYELARMLGMSIVSTQRQFARWRAGQGMNFDTTIKLLEIAGLLRAPPKP